MKLSVIVPCYNEADNLATLIEAFRAAIADRSGVEVVLVNNGSTDDSSAVLDRELAKPENRCFRQVMVPKNQGYGFGILSGLRQAHGEYLAWTHADMQTDPAHVLAGFDHIVAHADSHQCFLRGVRQGRPLFDRFFTGGMSVIASLSLGSKLYDVNAQPKIFHRGFLRLLDDAPHDFSLDLYALHLANQRKLHILEQPVNFDNRLHGEAKGGGSLRGKYKLTVRTLKFIFALRAKLCQPGATSERQQPRRAA